jgi:hypothetical protein
MFFAIDEFGKSLVFYFDASYYKKCFFNESH